MNLSNDTTSKIERLQKSFWLYWVYYFLLWFEGYDPQTEIRNYHSSSRNPYRRVSESPKPKPFNPYAGSVTKDKDKTIPMRRGSGRGGVSIFKDTPTPNTKAKEIVEKEITRVKVRTASGRETYKNDDNLDIGDIILAKAVYDSINHEYKNETIEQVFDNWNGFDRETNNFNGFESRADEFAGAGSGGGWGEEAQSPSASSDNTNYSSSNYS